MCTGGPVNHRRRKLYPWPRTCVSMNYIIRRWITINGCLRKPTAMILLMRNYVPSVKEKSSRWDWSASVMRQRPRSNRGLSSTRKEEDPGRRTIRGIFFFSRRKSKKEELFYITRDYYCVVYNIFFESSYSLFRLFSFPRKIEFENSSCSTRVLGQLPEWQPRFKEEDRGMKNLLESPIFYDWIFQVDFPRLDSKFKVLWRVRERDVGALWNILIKKTFS